jgi:hypothetical protein
MQHQAPATTSTNGEAATSLENQRRNERVHWDSLDSSVYAERGIGKDLYSNKGKEASDWSCFLVYFVGIKDCPTPCNVL